MPIKKGGKEMEQFTKKDENYYIDDNNSIWKSILIANLKQDKYILYVSRIDGENALQYELAEGDDEVQIIENHLSKF